MQPQKQSKARSVAATRNENETPKLVDSSSKESLQLPQEKQTGSQVKTTDKKPKQNINVSPKALKEVPKGKPSPIAIVDPNKKVKIPEFKPHPKKKVVPNQPEVSPAKVPRTSEAPKKKSPPVTQSTKDETPKEDPAIVLDKVDSPPAKKLTKSVKDLDVGRDDNLRKPSPVPAQQNGMSSEALDSQSVEETEETDPAPASAAPAKRQPTTERKKHGSIVSEIVKNEKQEQPFAKSQSE